MLDVHALLEEGSKTRAQAFQDAEASLRLEGLDPSSDSRYQAIKAKLIAGTMSFDEAEAALKAQYGVHTIAALAASA